MGDHEWHYENQKMLKCVENPKKSRFNLNSTTILYKFLKMILLILQESSNSENSKLKSKKKTNKISQKKVFFRFFGKIGTFYKFEISEIVKCVP